MTAEEYMIGELAKIAGVSVRTIRYYISEGLLPSPQSRGRYTVYDDEYIDRIELIKRLKEAFLPIKEIRVMLDTKSKAEINEFLRNFENTRPSGNDALDYIADLMENKKVYSPQPSRLQYQSPPAAMESRQSPVSAAKSPRDFGDEENWKRFKIIPGFEIHITERIFNRHERVVLQLIEKAKALLSK